MSWGVATQNGVSVSLASIVSLSCGATEFSPLSLFTSGAKGAWYDPSDYTSLFQDSVGTTPVTVVEQPVGLMLDKSQGLATTAAPIDGNMNTATWTKGTGWSAPSARSIVCDGSQTSSSDTTAVFTKSASTIVKWTFNITAISGTLLVYATGGAPQTYTTTGSKTVYSDTASNFNIFRINGAGQTCTITDITIQVIPGNHALQATTASRPVLRARYNLLTYSEQFDNAAWTKVLSASVSANTDTAPDGTLTADTFIAGAANSALRQTVTLDATPYTYSVWIKRKTGTGDVQISVTGGSWSTRAVTNEWTRFTITQTPTAGSNFPGIRMVTSGDEVYIWGADLRTGSSAGTYQRIAAATDYATAGFLPYLDFITDDSLATGSIDFSATDKMTVCAGVTKLSDAAVGLVVGIGPSANTTNGSFEFFTGGWASVGAKYGLGLNAGSTLLQCDSPTDFAAPITNVITWQLNNAGSTTADKSSMRANAVSKTLTYIGSGSTGNFTSQPLYVGRRAGSATPLNGRISQMIVVGKTLSASELASTESFVATKTGVTL